MRVVGLEELRGVFDRRAILAAVRDALDDHAAGRVQAPPPTHLEFGAAGGDAHVKTAHRHGAATFAVKIATGFYRNPDRGLPANSGLVAVLSADTGAPLAILRDEGWLTAWRTAAATTLAALALAPVSARSVGVVGAGLQASLALEWLGAERPELERIVWSRDPSRAAALADRTGARAVGEIADLLASADIVVTATPSRAPLFEALQAGRPRLFVGVGADMPGKRELPAALFAEGTAVVVDDLEQSLDHGDWGAAVREGASRSDAAILLGDLLTGRVRVPNPNAPTIVDLTGIAATDTAIAELFCGRLGLSR